MPDGVSCLPGESRHVKLWDRPRDANDSVVRGGASVTHCSRLRAAAPPENPELQGLRELPQAMLCVGRHGEVRHPHSTVGTGRGCCPGGVLPPTSPCASPSLKVTRILSWQ